MASTFMGLAITSRGLSAAQTGLATTSNNMSNVNTTGYSRQVLNQVAVGPAAVYSSNNYVGSGVSVTSVDRVRSYRLDQKYWQENSASGYWETKSSYLTELEDVLGDTTDTSFTSTLNEFYSSLEDLSDDTSSTTARAVVVEDAKAVCAYLNDSYDRLQQLRSDVNTDIKTTVQQINSYAEQIASLNQQIAVAQGAGAAANELEDSRDALVDKLSALADIEVNKTTVGTAADGSDITSYYITLSGSTLVSNNSSNELECTTGGDGMYNVVWKDTQATANVGDSGQLASYMELRDGTGTNGETKGIPYYINQLNTFAQSFAQAFNEGTSSYSGHVSGYGTNDATGIRFFTYTDSTTGEAVDSSTFIADGTTDTTVIDAAYNNITAGNISVSADILEDSANIAASSAADEESNNENLDDLISLCENSDSGMFPNGTAEDFYTTVVTTLGCDSAYAKKQYSLQDNITSYISDSRSSVSGVSTDEETVNLTKYQEAYEASAQLVSTWNEVYETTINMVSSD